MAAPLHPLNIEDFLLTLQMSGPSIGFRSKTKGLQKVNLYGGFNFYKENNYVKWSFCPVQFIKDTVTITVDQK